MYVITNMSPITGLPGAFAFWGQGRFGRLRLRRSCGTTRALNSTARERLTYAASADEFLTAWQFLDWNEFRVRVVGAS